MRFSKILFKPLFIPVLIFSLTAALWAGSIVPSSLLFDNFSVGFEKTVLLEHEPFGSPILRWGQVSDAMNNGEWPEPVLKIADKSKNRQITEIPAFAFSRTTPDISSLIVSAIDNTSESVEVALYGMTLPNVAEALVRARDRGVKVRLILNEKHTFVRRSEEIQYLIDNEVNIRTLRGLGSYGVMHNKIGIFDSKLMMTGSFNWVVSANVANTENVVFTSESKPLEGYEKCFEWMWSYSRSLEDGQSYDNRPDNYFGVTPVDANPSIKFNSITLPSYSFSPRGDTADSIIAAINTSKEKITAAIFSFYSVPIAEALVDAVKRGVAVSMIVDKVQASQSSVVEYVIKNGVKLRLARGHNKGVMHHKFAVMDDKLLMTGSFNWSNNAQQNNFENMIYTTSSSHIKGFAQEFADVYSTAYTPLPEDFEKDDIGMRSLELGFGGGYPNPFDIHIEFSN